MTNPNEPPFLTDVEALRLVCDRVQHLQEGCKRLREQVSSWPLPAPGRWYRHALLLSIASDALWVVEQQLIDDIRG